MMCFYIRESELTGRPKVELCAEYEEITSVVLSIDEIRNLLIARGYMVEDVPGGTRIKRKN